MLSGNKGFEEKLRAMADQLLKNKEGLVDGVSDANCSDYTLRK